MMGDDTSHDQEELVEDGIAGLVWNPTMPGTGRIADHEARDSGFPVWRVNTDEAAAPITLAMLEAARDAPPSYEVPFYVVSPQLYDWMMAHISPSETPSLQGDTTTTTESSTQHNE